MAAITLIPWLAAGLILARVATELWLAQLNRRHVLAHADPVPLAFREVMDPATYEQSVRYTLARGRFGQATDLYDAVVLLLVLFSGLLPWAFQAGAAWLGDTVPAQATVLFGVGAALALTGLPFQWYSDFCLEQRFGFNTTTAGTWLLDRLKGFLLAAMLGWPLLALLLHLVTWAGPLWWLWGWVCLLGFQLVMTVLAPVVILPLFNRFAPLAEGSLRARLLALAARTGFLARRIEVMDGSRRSRHANAFFIGLGRWRKIVLFDTLVHQLDERELEAVLAHEIGHCKLRHIPKLMTASAAGSLAGFAVLGWLAQQAWFPQAFGFAQLGAAPVLLLFGLLAGTLTFWLSPLTHHWSRRYEYQADAFAARTLGGAESLVKALRKLNEKNLSNLTPHPLYSRFYYSHPALLERERALVAEGEALKAGSLKG